MKDGIKASEISIPQSPPPSRLDLSHTRFKSESRGHNIESEERTGFKHHVLETEPDHVELDATSELSSVPSDYNDEHGLSPIPSDLSDTDITSLGLPTLGEAEDEDEEDEPHEPDDFNLDPVLFITSPCIGSIIGLKHNSPLCDFDDLLRLATQQTAQEITDSVNALRKWSTTRREVQALIQLGIQRVADSRGVSMKVVAAEMEEVKRENGVIARERGRPRRKSGDEVVRVYVPAGTGGRESVVWEDEG